MESGALVRFPDYYDGLYELEVRSKGRMGDVLVVIDGLGTFSLTFMDPDRIRQDLDGEIESGGIFLAEQNLIVVQEVSRKTMVEAINKLVKEGFFKKIVVKPSG